MPIKYRKVDDLLSRLCINVLNGETKHKKSKQNSLEHSRHDNDFIAKCVHGKKKAEKERQGLFKVHKGTKLCDPFSHSLQHFQLPTSTLFSSNFYFNLLQKLFFIIFQQKYLQKQFCMAN